MIPVVIFSILHDKLRYNYFKEYTLNNVNFLLYEGLNRDHRIEYYWPSSPWLLLLHLSHTDKPPRYPSTHRNPLTGNLPSLPTDWPYKIAEDGPHGCCHCCIPSRLPTLQGSGFFSTFYVSAGPKEGLSRDLHKTNWNPRAKDRVGELCLSV